MRKFARTAEIVCCISRQWLYVVQGLDERDEHIYYSEERRPMSATVSDVASATSILLAVCLVVLLTLIAICRLLRLGTFAAPRSRRCSDGTKCAGGVRPSQPDVAPTVERCLPANVSEDESATSVASASDQQCSSKIDLEFTQTDTLLSLLYMREPDIRPLYVPYSPSLSFI